MQCPKCGQTYPGGSQRFCDLDGARLVSGSGDVRRRVKQGVFSTILPIKDIEASRDKTIGEEPRFANPAPQEKLTDDRLADMYFETDDDDETHFSTISEHDLEIAGEPLDDRAFGRRIHPQEIPAGHVELGDRGEREHPSVRDTVFDIDDPSAFVGHKVKGRYDVTEMLGGDDTGFAFLAEDRIVEDKRVMVRILTNEEFDEVTKSIFAEERISLSHLNHPNIVRVIDSGQFVDGTTFLISEHIDALSVDDILQIHGPLNAMRVARIIRQAGNGLSEVHNEGILHRDLRPEDLMLAQTNGEAELVKLSDFGVSDGEPNAENLPYKAPEILDGRIPTIASDIYSLGVIAFQILTGRLPFSGETPKELLRSERAGLKVPPTARRRDVIPPVDYVFSRVLAPDPLLRYPTAREFGDALYGALTAVPESEAAIEHSDVSQSLMPENFTEDEAAISHRKEAIAGTREARTAALATDADDDPAWTRRSPEPLNEPHQSWVRIVVIGFAALFVIAAGIWYYMLNRPAEPEIIVPSETALPPGKVDPASQRPDGSIQIEVPPLPRDIEQPPNTDFFQNSRQNLKGDILRNFVGFSIYYPKDWRVTGPQEGDSPTARGKFLDIARNTPDGKLKEQMLIGYYPSNGTFTTDSSKFAELARESNEMLKKLIPNFQMVSEGETTVNGGWRAYEVKFQGSGTSENGRRLLVWGRRLFLPASRPGVRSGFEITMLATSDADDVHSVDDVGTRGELAAILYTFEPNQSF